MPGIQRVGTAQWDTFKQLIRDAQETFAKDIITWKRAIKDVPLYFEDDIVSGFETDVSLEVLIGYNTFRTWPLTRHTLGGELDEENMIAIFSKEYLEELGHLTAKGYFNFNTAADRFVHKGIKYRGEGDTAFSQAYDDGVHIVIILSREEVLTGTDRLDQ